MVTIRSNRQACLFFFVIIVAPILILTSCSQSDGRRSNVSSIDMSSKDSPAQINPTEDSAKSLATTSNTSSTFNQAPVKKEIEAYQVWLGLHCIPQEAIENPTNDPGLGKESWALTAAKVQGLNCNPAPYKPIRNQPFGSYHECTDQNWIDIVSQFAAKNNGFTTLPLSAMRDEESKKLPTGQAFVDKLKSALQSRFKEASKKGYTLKSVMFYSNRLGSIMYDWTPEQITVLRQCLDDSGHKDVTLIWNARNNAAARAYCFNNDVDIIMLEAEDLLWYENAGNRQTLLKDIWNNTNKQIILQIPVHKENPFGNPSSYQRVRRLVRWLGIQMGQEFLKSSRVVFLPVTYNGSLDEPGSMTFRFCSETKDGGASYENSLTGIALSLIEQREMFINGATQEQADSYTRMERP